MCVLAVVSIRVLHQYWPTTNTNLLRFAHSVPNLTPTTRTACSMWRVRSTFAKEPWKRDNILQKRPIIFSTYASLDVTRTKYVVDVHIRIVYLAIWGICLYVCVHTYSSRVAHYTRVLWLWSVGSIKLQVSFAKEPWKRDSILQKRPIIRPIPQIAIGPDSRFEG